MKNILIYGLGKSGLASAEFFNYKGVNLFLFDDDKKIDELKNINLEKIDLAIVSPGVSEDTELYKKLENKSVKIISELELGYLNVAGEIIAVTGTNGKTTTVSLIGHIFSLNNKNSFVAGNIGLPLISLWDKTNKDSKIICEVSSFQLLKIEKFKPKISAVLNLAPDHIIRHKNFDNYINAKCRIFENQTQDEICVLNYDDELTRKLKNKTQAQIYFFSRENQMGNDNFEGVFCFNERIYFKKDKSINFIMSTSKIRLIGNKNLENVLAAVLISILCNINSQVIENAVNSFLPLKNRLQTVLTKHGVTYINDSKATNIASTLADVSAIGGNIVLLLGGSDKGEDFETLFKNLKPCVHKCVLYGATKENMKKCADLNGYLKYIMCEDFKSAVIGANEISKELSGSGVKNFLLLAPACASFDEFKDYEERGERFTEIVLNLD